MKRFIFSLPDELMDRVEVFRRERGLKATAEAVRELLERGLGDGVLVAAVPAPRPRPMLPAAVERHTRSRTEVVAPKRSRVEVAERFIPVDFRGEPIPERKAHQKKR